MVTDTGSDTNTKFAPIDWEEVGTSTPLLSRRTVAFLITLGILGALFCYDWFIVSGANPTLTVGRFNWDITRLDWLFLLSLLALVFYGVVPLVRNPQQTRLYWQRLRTNKLAVVSLLYLAMFFVIGTVGSLVLGQPRPSIIAEYQPPMFLTTDAGSVAINCIGEVTQAGTNNLCHGTLQYPLGTTGSGEDMVTIIVAGMRVALQVALITSTIIVPIATGVGTVAGYAGGLIDEVLMRYVDIQQTVPAFLVYIILGFVLGSSLFLIVLVFGLLSWGGVARLVRSETLQRREKGYIMAARNAGVSRVQILRRHLLPNVSSTVITAITQLIPLLLLAEAALAFLNLGVVALPSWGQMIARGFRSDYFIEAWWVSTVPLLFLIVTIVAFSLLGDALRDVLDPREMT